MVVNTVSNNTVSAEKVNSKLGSSEKLTRLHPEFCNPMATNSAKKRPLARTLLNAKDDDGMIFMIDCAKMMHIHRMNELHEAFIAHLNLHDPILAQIAKKQGPISLDKPTSHFHALCRAIVGQQLSTKAAATIYERLNNWAIQQNGLTPELILKIDLNQLRQLGLSQQKSTYLTALSHAWIEHEAEFAHLDSMDNDAILNALCSIKGIGSWTAQMFLIFTLHRSDVFAPNDLGIKKAMEKIYDFAMASNEKSREKFALKWSPYRSLACLHLWKSLEE